MARDFPPYPGTDVFARTFGLGFRFLAWLNGVGCLIVMLCALGVLQTDLGAPWLKLPLAAFLAGLALCGLGLLWSYLVQISLFGQSLRGESRRTHWIPLFCAMVAYALSLAAFVAGCWFTLTLSALIYQADDSASSQGYDDFPSPSDQWGEVSDPEPRQEAIQFRSTWRWHGDTVVFSLPNPALYAMDKTSS